MEISEKYNKLCDFLQQLKSVTVAFSGGADSALLLKAAHDALGEKACAVTVKSVLITESELSGASELCCKIGARQIVVEFDPFGIGGFGENPPDRCYRCKKAIFGKILEIAQENNCTAVCEGSNLDDEGDYRPGMIAIRELGIISPLLENGFTKADIRELSHKLGLPTWNKPSLACLASRFPYGEEISAERLSKVAAAEEFLFGMGLSQARVRVHGKIARIEALPDEFSIILDENNRREIYGKLQKLGFGYITLDLLGYRTGSMNEVLGNCGSDRKN